MGQVWAAPAKCLGILEKPRSIILSQAPRLSTLGESCYRSSGEGDRPMSEDKSGTAQGGEAQRVEIRLPVKHNPYSRRSSSE